MVLVGSVWQITTSYGKDGFDILTNIIVKGSPQLGIDKRET